MKYIRKYIVEAIQYNPVDGLFDLPQWFLDDFPSNDSDDYPVERKWWMDETSKKAKLCWLNVARKCVYVTAGDWIVKSDESIYPIRKSSFCRRYTEIKGAPNFRRFRDECCSLCGYNTNEYSVKCIKHKIKDTSMEPSRYVCDDFLSIYSQEYQNKLAERQWLSQKKT
jgi:hypothetical protein